MKRAVFLIAALLGIVFTIDSCTKNLKEYEIEIEIVNNSSFSISGDLWYVPFEVAPGEVYTHRSFYSSTLHENPTPAEIGIVGPKVLTVDGTSYTWKSGQSESDFFSYRGWDITSFGDGFICRLVLTDEAIADMLSHADPS